MYKKFCVYNFVLKGVPNKNDYAHGKYMLNEAPNRNDATDISNNVHLTTMGAKQLSMTAVYIVIMQKIQLTRDER